MSSENQSPSLLGAMWAKTQGIRVAIAIKSIISAITLPIFASVMLMYYTVKEGIPAFDALSYIGSNSVYIFLLSAVLVMAFAFYALLPRVILEMDPSCEHSGPFEKRIKRVFELNGPAIIAYAAISSYVFSDFILYEDYVYALSAASSLLMLILMILWWRERKDHESSSHLEMVAAGNLATLFIMVSVYLLVGLSAFSSQDSTANHIYQNAVNYIGQRYADFVFIISLSALPIAIVSGQVIGSKKAWRNTLMLVLSVSSFFVFIFPGGSSFVRASLNIFKIGGGMHVTVWMKPELACRHPAILDPQKRCGEVANLASGEQISADLKVAFATEKYLYIPISRTEDGETGTKKFVLAIPRSDISSLRYTDRFGG